MGHRARVVNGVMVVRRRVVSLVRRAMEMGGRLGEKSDGDGEKTQRSDANSVESGMSVCTCPPFGI